MHGRPEFTTGAVLATVAGTACMACASPPRHRVPPKTGPTPDAAQEPSPPTFAEAQPRVAPPTDPKANREPEPERNLSRRTDDVGDEAQGELPKLRSPTVKVGNSPLSPEEIRRVVRSHMPQVRACYERELAKQPTLEGQVSIAFTIGPQGAVQGTRIKGSDPSLAEVTTCLANEIQGWSFPAPRGGGVVEVAYPFIFTPG